MSIQKHYFAKDGSVAILDIDNGSPIATGGFVVKGGKITGRLWGASREHALALDAFMAISGGEGLLGKRMQQAGTQEITWLGRNWSLIPLDKTLEELQAVPGMDSKPELLRAIAEHMAHPTPPSGWKTVLTRSRPGPPVATQRS